MLPSRSCAVHETFKIGVQLACPQRVESRNGYSSKLSCLRTRIRHLPLNGSHSLEFQPTVFFNIANSGPRENCDA